MRLVYTPQAQAQEVGFAILWKRVVCLFHSRPRKCQKRGRIYPPPQKRVSKHHHEIKKTPHTTEHRRLLSSPKLLCLAIPPWPILARLRPLALRTTSPPLPVSSR